MFRIAGGVGVAVLLLACSSPALGSEPEDTPCDQLSHLQVDAEHDDPRSQLRLAKLYFSGHCVAQSAEEGAKWLVRSAKLGYGAAQGFMSVMFYKEHRYEEAQELAHQAADKGDARGQDILAFMYRDGDGVAKDEAEAARWAKRSAEQGDGGGQGALAEMYYQGRGVQKDYVEADKWYVLANQTAYENEWLDKGRKRTELHMTRRERNEAQRRAASWRPTIEPQSK